VLSLYDISGLVGSAAIIIAYLLLQTGKIDPVNSWYSILNAAGAALIIVSLIFSWNLAAFIIETFWLIISIYGLIKNTLISQKRG